MFYSWHCQARALGVGYGYGHLGSTKELPSPQASSKHSCQNLKTPPVSSQKTKSSNIGDFNSDCFDLFLKTEVESPSHISDK